jgi:hypothetical protein
MKPRGNSLISALERIRQTQHRRGSFEEKNGVYHKKAEEVYRELSASQSTDLGPMLRVAIGFGISENGLLLEIRRNIPC